MRCSTVHAIVDAAATRIGACLGSPSADSHIVLADDSAGVPLCTAITRDRNWWAGRLGSMLRAIPYSEQGVGLGSQFIYIYFLGGM